MVKNHGLILILLFIIMFFPLESIFTLPIEESNPIVSPKIKPSLEEAIVSQSEYDRYTKVDKLLDMGIIKIKSDMVILDIGTGTGFFAFKFAENLKGRGMVFATDVLADRIDYIKKEADIRGLRNLYPVLVNREGVDDFYSKHKYDLIFICKVYHLFRNRVSYFKKMKNFLKKDGELIVVLNKSVTFFQLDDISDFKGLIRELSQELYENKPFYERLHRSTKEMIKRQCSTEPDEILKNAIITDFNKILLNAQFYNNFQGKFIYKTVSFSPAEEDFYNWLIMCLKEESSFDKIPKNLTPKEVRAIIKLNKLLFLQRFRHYFYMNGRILFFQEDQVHAQTSKFLVERELKEAGYELKEEYNELPYHDVLFFVASNNNESK